MGYAVRDLTQPIVDSHVQCFERIDRVRANQKRKYLKLIDLKRGTETFLYKLLAG